MAYDMFYRMDPETHAVTPCGVDEWQEAFMNPQRRIVAQAQAGEAAVSTIFLGIDAFAGVRRGSPQVFETMVFGGELDGRQVRTCTYDKALRMHRATVDACMQAHSAAQALRPKRR